MKILILSNNDILHDHRSGSYVQTGARRAGIPVPPRNRKASSHGYPGDAGEVSY